MDTQVLNLRDTGLTTLPENFCTLTELTTLFLDDNQLTALPENFGMLTNLTLLFLNHNQLTALPEDFRMLTNLTYLRLDNNPFSAELLAVPNGGNRAIPTLASVSGYIAVFLDTQAELQAPPGDDIGV